jgi:hypothetical protein
MLLMVKKKYPHPYNWKSLKQDGVYIKGTSGFMSSDKDVAVIINCEKPPKCESVSGKVVCMRCFNDLPDDDRTNKNKLCRKLKIC